MAPNNHIYVPFSFATKIRLELRGLRLKILHQASDTSTYIRYHSFNFST